MSQHYVSRRRTRSEFALHFFALSAVLLGIALVVSSVLTSLFSDHSPGTQGTFPGAFVLSTLLLFGGGVSLTRAVAFVKREKQASFRKSLAWGMAFGTAFVATQFFALAQLIRRLPADEVATGAAAMVAVFAALHAMHFIVAFLFLTYVAVQAHADRYDHEYHWGVRICAWFWHALEMAWCVVLVAMLIASIEA